MILRPFTRSQLSALAATITFGSVGRFGGGLDFLSRGMGWSNAAKSKSKSASHENDDNLMILQGNAPLAAAYAAIRDLSAIDAFIAFECRTVA
jgi:hypothetical protein